MTVVTTTWGTSLNGCIIRKVENHCYGALGIKISWLWTKIDTKNYNNTNTMTMPYKSMTWLHLALVTSFIKVSKW